MELYLPPKETKVMRVIKKFGQKSISGWHILKPNGIYFYCNEYIHPDMCEYEVSTIGEIPQKAKMCRSCWKF